MSLVRGYCKRGWVMLALEQNESRKDMALPIIEVVKGSDEEVDLIYLKFSSDSQKIAVGGIRRTK